MRTERILPAALNACVQRTYTIGPASSGPDGLRRHQSGSRGSAGQLKGQGLSRPGLRPADP